MKLPVHIKEDGEDLSSKAVLETVQSNSIKPAIEIAAGFQTTSYNLFPACLAPRSPGNGIAYPQFSKPSLLLYPCRQRAKISCLHSHVGRQVLVASYYSSHLSPKCHLTGMPYLIWDASTGPHFIPDRVCGFEVMETGDTQKFRMCSPKNQEYFTAKEPNNNTDKDPILAPAISELSMHESSETALQRRMPGTVTFTFLQEPCLEEHLAFIFFLVLDVAISGSVSPAHTVSSFLLSPQSPLPSSPQAPFVPCMYKGATPSQALV